MALETVTYIADLVPANPTPGDAKSQGDDHIRNTKTAVLNGFVGFPGAVMAMGTDGGAVNAYTVTPSRALIAYSLRMSVIFSPTVANTGASTLNVSGLGDKPLKRIDGTGLVPNDLLVGNIYAAAYNGTEFRLLSITKEYIDQLAFNQALPSQFGNGGKPLVTNGSTASFSGAFGVAIDEAKGADVASAATLNLTSGPGTGNLVHVTGTTAITAITLPSGAERTLVFDGVLTLTNSANLILPSGVNIVTTAGDTAIVRGDGAGVVRVIDYVRASGRAVIENPPPGMVLLATVTPTASGAVDLLTVFTSAFDNYIVMIDSVGSDSASPGELCLQFANAGVVDSGTKYSTSVFQATGGTAGANDTSFKATPNNGGTGMARHTRLEIHNANDTAISVPKLIYSVDMMRYQSGSFYPVTNDIRVGEYVSANAASGLRLLWAGSGSVFRAGGKVRVYGLRN